ncbi:MAG: dihydrofolate reductase [Rubrivivax sp.]|nr:dihydrofolate reductase [Rubrivivax sp.]
MRLALIAAVARNGVIGRDNGLVWHEPLDQKHFRSVTMGCPVVMGRKTWESLPARFRPLPGRRNVVVTRKAAYDAPGARTAGSLDAALAGLADAPQVFVIGGAELYALALPRADTLELTEIGADLQGDTHFPPFAQLGFAETARTAHTAADGTPFSFVSYTRQAGFPVSSRQNGLAKRGGPPPATT